MRTVLFAFGTLLIGVCVAAQTSAPEPDIVVGSVTLNGVSKMSPADQQQIIQDVESHRYSHRAPSAVANEVAQRVHWALETRGYFKSRVGEPEIRVVSLTPLQETIAISLTVNEGERYRLDTVTFEGVKAFPEQELRRLFPINQGDIFNTEAVRKGLDDMRSLYASKGYINFTPVPETQVNEVAQTVSLQVMADEGPVFRVGKLQLDGVETRPGAGAELLAAWKQYEGKVFAPEILTDFAQRNAALLPPEENSTQLFKTRVDGQARLVNVQLELPSPTQ